MVRWGSSVPELWLPDCCSHAVADWVLLGRLSDDAGAVGSHLCFDEFGSRKKRFLQTCYSSAATATPVATTGTTAQRSVPGQSTVLCRLPVDNVPPTDSLEQCSLQVLLPDPPEAFMTSGFLVDQGAWH